MNIERIQTLAKQIAPEVIAWRRHIHSNPELSYEEFETAAFEIGRAHV